MRYTLGELAEIIDGDRGKNYPQQSEFMPEGYCLFLNTGNVTESGFSFENNQFISKEKCDLLRKGKLKRRDIVYTTRGTVGNAGFFSESVPYEHMRINSGMVIIRPNEDVVCTEFLYQILKSRDYRLYFQQYCTGSAQPQLPIKNLSKIELDIPPLEKQYQIANMLSAYDDLIENNQRQIKFLEEAAQRLYKEWFVDLRFPGHETTPIVDGVPEGWKKCLLSDIIGYEIGGGWGEEKPTERCDIPAYVIRGTDLYGITHGDSIGIPYRYHEKKKLDTRRLIDGDVVFEVSGGSKTEGVARTTLIRFAMLEQWREPVMCASFCKLIRVEEPKYAQLLFDAFRYMRASGKTAEYDKRSASSIVNYRWKDFLATETVLIPDGLTLEKYNALADNMYQLIVQKSISIGKAKDARDRLLPKLMSGEIEV